MLFASCSSTETPAAEDAEAGAKLEKKSIEVVLNGDSVTCASPSVQYDAGKVTINSAGTYLISGTLNNGMIYVNCVDAGIIDLVLKGVNITNETGACIYVQKTQGAVITLYEGDLNWVYDQVKAIELKDLSECRKNISSNVQSFISNSPNEGSLYDFTGRQIIGQPQRGMYIRNGRKIVIK